MPLNVRSFYSSLLVFLIGMFAAVNAQTVPSAAPSPASATQQTQPSLSQPLVQQVRTPTAAEIMRDRVAKAKAFIAVRNYNAANYELESIRRESADQSLLAVVNVLLMNSYLEQGDYRRAQDFLNEAYKAQSTSKPDASANYFAVASQIVKGARNRVERYRALGLNPSDRMLPLEAVNDLEKMRETLELVVTQSKAISKDKTKTPDAMALLEEASVSRSMIARDDYDASKWQNEMADAREDIASSRSVVLSAVTEMPAAAAPSNQTVAQNAQQVPMITNTGYSQPTSSPASNQPLVKPTVSSQPINAPQQTTDTPQFVPTQQPERNRVISEQTVTQTPVQTANTSQPVNQPINNKPVQQPSAQPSNDSSTTASAATPSGPSAEPSKDSGPLNVGLLLPYAAKQQAPVYPSAARSMRTSGIVNVTVTIDEQGNVAEVQNATGPSMLQAAAKDAIRKWRFKPFVRDGQPVKAVGYVSFNFTL
jgi:TonB family protein